MITRRELLKGAAAGAAFSIVPASVLAARGSKKKTAPSNKLNIGAIGFGSQGAANLAAVALTENITALCDVDPDYVSKIMPKYPQVKKLYADYREMLAQEKELDGVIIATPDHTHAVITMAAMKAGKHVYTQKPLTHNVWEARMLAEAAAKYGVVSQMGIQGHSGDGIRLITEWVQSGAIGEVREVDAWCDLTYYPWGHAYWSSKWGDGRPKDTPPVPKGLNWDLWLGPAPTRPYHPAYHPMVWRCWWDFGNGMMGDRGAHTLDPVVTALKLGPPSSVDATSCGNTKEVHPLSSVVTYQFPAREGMPPVKVTWYEGTRPPRPENLEDDRKWPAQGGAIIKGSKASIWCGVYGDSPRIFPEAKMKELLKAQPPSKLARGRGDHEQDWVKAIKEGRKAGADFSYSGPLTEICMLGNVAKQVDARIHWDHAAMRVTNLEAANQYIKPVYRDGWSL